MMSVLERLAFAEVDPEEFGENRRPLADNPAERATEYEIALSTAISLKRIADLLDGTTIGICVTETIFNPATVQNRETRNHY